MKKVKIKIVSTLLLTFFLFSLDFISKYWVHHHLPRIEFSSSLFPYGGIGIFKDFLGIDFCITHAANTGGAWNLLSTHPNLLLYLRLVIIISLFIFIIFFNKQSSRNIPFILIAIGAIGNILDTFIYGAVVDMLYFNLWGYSFPIFNVADTMIFCGVSSLMVQMLLQKNRKESKLFPLS